MLRYNKLKELISKDFLLEHYIRLDKSVCQISRETKIDKRGLIKLINEFGLKKEVGFGNILYNEKYGRLTTLLPFCKIRDKKCYWVCECECGNIAEVRSSKLKEGSTKSCGCLIKNNGKNLVPTSGEENITWKGYKEISGTKWASYKRSAKDRNLEFDLRIEDLWDLYEQQNKKCKLSGLDIPLGTISSIASIDRVDNTKGYCIDNVCWVHKDINRIKYTADINDFINRCKKIKEFKREFSPQEIIKEIYRTLYSRYKGSCLSRNLAFEIEEQDIINQYNNQGGICYFSGEDIILPRNNKEYSNAKCWNFSIDRIDNSIGYTKDNINIITKEINMSRGHYTLEYYINLCTLVSNHNE